MSRFEELYLLFNSNVLKLLIALCLFPFFTVAQQKQLTGDSLVLSNPYLKLVVNLSSGKLSCRFASGVQFENASAYVKDVKAGLFSSTGYSRHSITTDSINDP